MAASDRQLQREIRHEGRQEVRLEPQAFDLTGGALCLDFANSIDDRLSARPREHLTAYDDLVAFARVTGALPDEHLGLLVAEARRRPAEAAAALERALALREAIYRLFVALATDRPVPADDLTALNAALGAALAHARVVPTAAAGAEHRDPGIERGDHSTEHRAPGAERAGPRFAWSWAVGAELDAPLWPVARSAADLLTSPRLGALRFCAAEDCAWLFLDTSRNNSRRWCSMRTCGNRVKARRHYARVRDRA